MLIYKSLSLWEQYRPMITYFKCLKSTTNNYRHMKKPMTVTIFTCWARLLLRLQSEVLGYFRYHPERRRAERASELGARDSAIHPRGPRAHLVGPQRAVQRLKQLPTGEFLPDVSLLLFLVNFCTLWWTFTRGNIIRETQLGATSTHLS